MQTLIFKAHVNRHFPSVYVCSNSFKTEMSPLLHI